MMVTTPEPHAALAKTDDVPVRATVDRRLLLAIPLAVLVLDQLVKLAMVEWLGPGADAHRWELAGRLVAFEYVENRGAAFGILPGQTTLLTVVALLITIGAAVMMYREAQRHPMGAIAIGLIVGGALGNIVDRIRLGYVVDFIAIGLWPTFNLADTAITVGIGLLLWSGLRDDGTPGERSADNQRGSVDA